MRTNLLTTIAILACLFFAVSAYGQSLTQGDTVPIFKVVHLVDLEQRLSDDARTLGIKFDTMKNTRDDERMNYENDEFFLSRRYNNGYFLFRAKKVERTTVTKGGESAKMSDLENRTISLLEGLGVKRSEIHKVYTRRAVMQTENAEGLDVGQPETSHFMVVVTRQIMGVPVFNSSARFLYTPDGELFKARFEWRTVEGEPVRMEKVNNPDIMQASNRERIAMRGNAAKLEIAAEGFAFVEGEFDAKQDVFELQYYTEYNFGSFRNIVFTDAAD